MSIENLSATIYRMLSNKNILLGVTGSIAAYKSAELARRLREVGANVRVAMTENAKKFITPLTMQAVSANTVHLDLFDLHAEAAMGHIELARWADAIIIAPASANFIADLAHGNANNLITTLCLATRAPIAIAPAMNQVMWENSLTQRNIQLLSQNNIKIFNPVSGSQACGDMGFGRMLEPLQIIDALTEMFISKELLNCRILITAGPTQESIDPVRYISNHSSGKMGYALAQAAVAAGAKVTLISGPVSLNQPHDVKFIPVVSAKQMMAEVLNEVKQNQIFISVAAVSDYYVENASLQKVAKENSLTLNLRLNEDIVKTVAALHPKPFIVGFAAETQDLLNHANNKRLAKQMDIIIANQVANNQGMGTDDNEVTFITATQEVKLAKAAKKQLANQLIQLIAKEFYHANSHQYGCANN